MPSDKTVVVEQIWADLEQEGRGRRIVFFEDVTAAIQTCNQRDRRQRSTKNPANFMKDLLRGGNASKNWPQSLQDLRITGQQVTGENRIFEFVEYREGQTDPFPNPFEPTGVEPEFVVQSISIPITTKSLGRKDESWLIQVAVKLNLLEVHFATSSILSVVELTHLQTGVKLNRTEIDSLFLAVLDTEAGRVNALITCEAKQHTDPILTDQLVQQVVSAYQSVKQLDMLISLVVPVAIKAVKDRASIYVAEFEPWMIEEAEAPEGARKELVVSCSATYRLKPPVPGIGFTPPRKKVAKKPAV